MKPKYKNKMIVWLVVLFFATPCIVSAQDSTKNELLLNLGYYMNNNKVIYLMVNGKTKIDRKFQPANNVIVNLYLDDESEVNLIGKVTTDENGKAKAIIPPTLKNEWDKSATHTFIGVSEANKEFDKTRAEAVITKTKITIDTLAGAETRTITVNVSSLKGNDWVPAKDVEIKIGIERQNSILNAGDDDTYTTDSIGIVNAEFKRDSLPGDIKGNLVMVAKVEDNDQYGNLIVKKEVPWGVATIPEKNFFDQRTLWTTRFKTPFWLLFMAYSIFIGIWGTLIYLVVQLVKIGKLGNAAK